MTEPRPNAHILELKPYHAAPSHDGSEDQAIRLSFNEGAFGPSPAARAAYEQALGCVHRYPDLHYLKLRRALADKYGIDMSRLVCGAGSDDLLTLLARAYAGPGDEIIYSQYGFAMYPIAAKSVGAVPVAVAEKDFRTDVDAILAHVTERTRIVFIANPNNPTGSYLSFDEVRRLQAGLPRRVMLVLDAAYAEYVEAADYRDGLELVEEVSNVVVTRTFSKIHALGGLRVGWGYMPVAVAEVLNRTRNPFNIAGPSVCAAIASLGDQAFLDRSRAHNTHWREWLMGQLAVRNDLRVLPSITNFVLVGLGSAELANALLRHLQDCRIQIRPMGGYALPDHVRMTIGREEEMLSLMAALKNFLGQA